jgi:hypothetical protein
VSWESARKDPAYGTAAWKRARADCLRRARWRCERGLPGCQGTATEANHRRGLAADPGHTDLEALCSHCHAVITSQQAHAAKQRRNDARPDLDVSVAPGCSAGRPAPGPGEFRSLSGAGIGHGIRDGGGDFG